jgi:glycine hydroxymethyltransferase
MSFLKKYLTKIDQKEHSKAAIAYLATLDHLQENHPKIVEGILQELKDQRSCLKMIASENYSSLATQLAMGNLLTDKYAEGFPGHRFYAGCENIDLVEEEAVSELKKLYQADHAYVQPHSGADANMIAFWSVIVQRIQNKELERLSVKNINTLTAEEYERIRQMLVNQKMMGMSLNAGGHLTHGYRMNMSSKMMQSIPYDVDPETHLLDYASILQMAKEVKPLILVAGYSAYPRMINFAKMREIAEEVDATLIVDMAHFSGLVAGKVMQGEYNPIPYAHIVTSTTHKTLRGPRGGMILCQNSFKESIDRGCPLVIGGPLPHVMAAKAVAFKEANTEDFQRYSLQVVKNCKALAERLMEHKVKLVTNGTDNHLLVMDTQRSFGLNGRQAEVALRKAGITANRNTVPYDPNGAWFTSGVRLGTAALTTRGLKEKEMVHIADAIYKLLKQTEPKKLENLENSKSDIMIQPGIVEGIHQEIQDLLDGFPLYPELVID